MSAPTKDTRASLLRRIARVRNIGVMAHIDAGKTTTTERILYYTGRTYKMGQVDEGTTVTDWMPEEQRRGITIVSAAVTTHWRECDINLIDTPGHVDFTAEVERSLRVLDGAIIVLCGVGGVEAQTETVWRQADRYRVPRIVFVNKLDRLGADFDRAVEEVRTRLMALPLTLQMPIGAGRTFEGVVDLLEMQEIHFDPSDYGKVVVKESVRPALIAEAEARRARLIEAVAEGDDAVMEAYLEERPLAPDDLRSAIRRLTLRARAVPVLCGSALNYQGVQPLLDAVCDYLPSPLDCGPVRGARVKGRGEETVERKPDPSEPFCALAFKVAYDRHDNLTYVRVYSGSARAGERVLNPRTGKRERLRRIYRMYANRRDEEIPEVVPGDIVGVVGLEDTVTGDTLCDVGRPIALEHLEFPDTVISMAVEPRSQADKGRLTDLLNRLVREDPTLKWRTDPDTGQMVLSGMGELHLDVVKNRMLEEFGVPANFGALRVAYRETISRPVEKQAEFTQQAGGRGQFARVTLRVEPTDAMGKVEFESRLKGAPLERAFLRAVEDGVRETALGGVITGYPLVNIRVALIAADVHPVDSTELAFYSAASAALRTAVEETGIRLLEPLMRLEIVLSEEHFGDVIKDLQSRRGEVLKMGERSGLRVIEARAPLAQLFGYATALRSLTRGRGTHTMEPAGYGEAPQDVAERILHGGW